MGSLLTVLIATLKSRITPLVTKVRYWTNWNFIRTKVIARIRDFFVALLNVKPRHKKDYYEIAGWLISKRLAFALVVAIGVVSIVYLASSYTTLLSAKASGTGTKTYSYNSVMLRFANGKVRIKAKPGYIAYEGEVESGAVTGYGTLYNADGVVVYQGNFEKNYYQGNGTRYYDSGNMMYTGAFEENLFSGTGSLYRETGSLSYKGEFALGKKEGAGELYDSGSNLVYTGNFSQDELLYNELLGKSAAEVAEAYTGNRTLYESDSDFVVLLEDIQAMYVGEESQTLDGDMTVETVMVLKDYFPAGSQSCATIQELTQYFGTEAYQGNSAVTMEEAVAINWLAGKDRFDINKVDMDTSPEYDDYITVDSFDEGYTVYIYSFQKDGMIYDFFCQDRDDGFMFYTIEQEEGAA